MLGFPKDTKQILSNEIPVGKFAKITKVLYI